MYLDESSRTTEERIVALERRSRVRAPSVTPQIPPGGGTVYHTDFVGRFVEATDSGIALEVETPQILGIDRATYTFRYKRIMSIRLL
jgi:hypothetical protein